MKLESLALRYVRAFLAVHPNETQSCLDKLGNFQQFLADSRLLIVVLQLPSLTTEQKDVLIQATIKTFNLTPAYASLMHHLVVKGRIALLDKIMKHITLYAMRAQGDEAFNVSVSHEFDATEQDALEALLTTVVGMPVKTTYHVDESLVCGFRAQSERFLLERSVRKSLQQIEQKLMRGCTT